MAAQKNVDLSNLNYKVNMDFTKIFIYVKSPLPLTYVVMTCTSSHPKSFLKPAVPPIRLFLMINMMPLKGCVVKGNYFTALLRHEA